MSIWRQVCLNISGTFDLIEVSSAGTAEFVDRLQGLQVQSSRCDFTDLENNAGAQQDDYTLFRRLGRQMPQVWWEIFGFNRLDITLPACDGLQIGNRQSKLPARAYVLPKRVQKRVCVAAARCCHGKTGDFGDILAITWPQVVGLSCAQSYFIKTYISTDLHRNSAI